MREVLTVADRISAIMEAEQSPVKNYLCISYISRTWVMNFIEGISTMTICGAFAGWYWTVPSKELSSTICCGRKSMYLVQKDKFPVLASLYRLCVIILVQLHWSLIIAIVQLSTVMEYINNKTKDLQRKAALLSV